MITTCPDFEKYGLNEYGEIVSNRRGSWQKLSTRHGVIGLHGKKNTTCKIAKFRYCVEHQISPLKISCVGALITSEGQIMTKADFMSRRNKFISKVRADVSKVSKIEKIKRHIEFCQASIEWLNGSPEKMFDLVDAEKEKICSLLYCNRILARDVVDEAELQLFYALDRGTVIDAYNWLIKRARGILVERKKETARFSDAKLKEMNNY